MARRCVGCHRPEYDATTAPDHAGAGFPTTCEGCHSVVGWRPVAGAIHEPGGAFPLSGGREAVVCTRCHDPGTFAAPGRVCQACHEADHRAAEHPNHVDVGFPLTCEACHTIAGWVPAAGGAHLPDGTFPLDGAHRGAACERCHADGDYAGADPACLTCHAGDYDGATAPAHGAEGIPPTCRDCHTTAAWWPSRPDPRGDRG